MWVKTEIKHEFILFSFDFKSTLSRFNLHTVKCAYLKGSLRRVLADVYVHEVTATIKTRSPCIASGGPSSPFAVGGPPLSQVTVILLPFTLH